MTDTPAVEGVTCPGEPRWDGDLVGCGVAFRQEPDREGIFDCPNCGLFFTREAAGGTAAGGAHAD